MAASSAPVLVGRHAPNGRAELLEWLNLLACTSYDTLEQMGDGIVYTQILEMLLVDAPLFLHKLASFDCCDQPKKEAPGPTESAGIRREKRERNLGLFQVFCRKHLPKRASIEINTTRLAEGKLQDHMLVAKWLYARVADAARTSGKGLRHLANAEQRRMDAACELGSPQLAPALLPAADAIVRVRRARLAKELAFLENSNRQQHHAPELAERPPTPPRTQAEPAHHSKTTPAASPRPEVPASAPNHVAELLEAVQAKLVDKARRVHELQQHLAQFVEMRNGLAIVTEHVRDEAEAACDDTADGLVAERVLHALTADAERTSVFTVMADATRP